MTAGYSGTPLPRKLGVKPGTAVSAIRAPRGFAATLGPLPEGATFRARVGTAPDHALLLAFSRTAAELRDAAERVPRLLATDGAAWFCWPKKAGSIPTEIAEADVRAAILGSGLVDVKICAVDGDWSGLKAVFRVADRARVAAGRTAHGPVPRGDRRPRP